MECPGPIAGQRAMSFAWVRPQQAPDDEVEVFSLGSLRAPDGSSAAEDDTGEILDERYELLEVMACGGTAAVYRTRDLHTGGLVATKVLYTGAREMVGPYFGQEGRLAARIRSPHVVHASHFGEDDGRLFIVFDLVPGSALSELYDGPMPWRELLNVVVQVLKALAAIHQHGVVHRDVKPDNVIVSRSLGEIHVTLLDLGFAVMAPAKRITGAPEPCRRVFGTFGFIAPELFAGRVPEPRCDLYSVGALMYTMLTAQPVPDLRPAPDVLVIPPPSAFVPGVAAAVDDIVMRALSDVEARFQNVREMADAVRAALAVAELPLPAAAPAVAAVTSREEDPEVLRPFRQSAQVDAQSEIVVGASSEPDKPISSKTAARTRAWKRMRIAAPSAFIGAGAVLLGLQISALNTGAMGMVEPNDAPEPTVAGTSESIQHAPPGDHPVPSTAPPPGPAVPAISPPASPAASSPAPKGPVTPLPDPAATGTLAANTPARRPRVDPGGPPSTRSRLALDPVPARITFAAAMRALEPGVRDCARQHGVLEEPRNVQVRRGRVDGEPLFVRVWGIPADHEFSRCIARIVREKPPPLDEKSPVQAFLFFGPSRAKM